MGLLGPTLRSMCFFMREHRTCSPMFIVNSFLFFGAFILCGVLLLLGLECGSLFP